MTDLQSEIPNLYYKDTMSQGTGLLLASELAEGELAWDSLCHMSRHWQTISWVTFFLSQEQAQTCPSDSWQGFESQWEVAEPLEVCSHHWLKIIPTMLLVMCFTRSGQIPFVETYTSLEERNYKGTQHNNTDLETEIIVAFFTNTALYGWFNA